MATIKNSDNFVHISAWFNHESCLIAWSKLILFLDLLIHYISIIVKEEYMIGHTLLPFQFQGVVTAIPAVLTPMTSGSDPGHPSPYTHKSGQSPSCMHYDSVNRSMAISGFSQTVKNQVFKAVFCKQSNDQGPIISRSELIWSWSQLSVSTVGIEVTLPLECIPFSMQDQICFWLSSQMEVQSITLCGWLTTQLWLPFTAPGNYLNDN